MLEHGTITTGARIMPRSHVVGVVGDRSVVAVQKRRTSSGVSSTRNAPALAEARARRPGGVGEGPVDDGGVDRLVGVVADHPAAAYDVGELHGVHYRESHA